MSNSLQSFLNWCQQRCEHQLTSLLENQALPSASLHAAVSYSLLAGGKRVRPALVYAAARACGELTNSTDYFACAVEAIHCYSLIHDDLPAMDDDDLRRGKPTNHKVHGEAMAILAGDLLQSLAFDWLFSHEAPATRLVAAQRVLAHAAGLMVNGQALDIEAVNTCQQVQALETMHRNKTGALIVASLKLGGISTDASSAELSALENYGKTIGLAFQVKDDILDVEAETATLGKKKGADMQHNKPTYVSLLGLEHAKELADELHANALQALDSFDAKADNLRQLADYIVNRQY